MKRIILLVLLITSLAYGQYTNWKSKTAEQLSGITSGVTNIASKSYWTSNAYAQIAVLFDMMEGFSEYTDTTTMKAGPADTSLRVAFLKQRASGDSEGGGWFVYSDSSTLATRIGSAVPDGGAIFDATGTGVVWVRQELLWSKDIPVKWYGTTHTALNSAINLCNTIKGRVIVEDTVTVTGTVTLKSNVHLIGAGKRNYIDRGSGFSGTMIDITANVSNVRFEGLHFDNSASTGYVLSESTTNFIDFTMSHCIFDSLDNFWQVTKDNGNQRIRVEYCTFNSTDYKSIFTFDGITDGWFQNNDFQGTTLKLEGNLRNIFVQYCLFDSVDQTNLFLRPGTDDTLWNIHADYNTFNACAHTAKNKGAIVYGEGGSGNQYMRYATLNGNIVNGHYGTGIGGGQAGNEVFDLEISDNIIHGGVEADTAHQKRDSYGINMIGAERFIFANNQIFSEGTNGIIINNSDGGLITGNRIENVGRDTTDTDHRKLAGIYIASGSNNLTVTNNYIENTGNSVADGAADEKAAGIVVGRSDAHGVDSIEVSYNRVLDSRTTKYTKYGIHIDEVATNSQLPVELVVMGNNCVGVDSLAFYMDSTQTRADVDQWRIYDNVGDSLTWNLTNGRYIRMYEQDNNFVFPASAGDSILVTLHPAAKGFRHSFFNFNATHTLQVDPQATDSINTNAAGKYAELHPGASMSIECFSNNKWTITKSSWSNTSAADSISFQP